MNPEQLFAVQFLKKYGFPVLATPGLPHREENDLRRHVMREELYEACKEMVAGNLPAIAHELADLVYAAYGAAATFGIDLDPIIAAVHNANMTKEYDPENPNRPKKGPGYRLPDVAQLLRDQGWTGE